MIKKQFKNLLLAQILSALAVTVCMLIDGMLIGRYLGTDSMASFGLAGSVITVFAAIGGAISSGGQIVCSKALGCGDSKRANTAFSTSVLTGLLISAAGTILVICFADRVAVLLGAIPESHVHHLTSDYLIGYMVGCPAFIGIQILNPFLQLAGKKKTVLMSIGVMIVFNVAADLLNVFVFHGGTLGMGLASSVSYYAALIIALSYFLKDKSVFSFSRKKVSRTVLKSILALGTTYAIYQLCRALSQITLNHIFMTKGGSDLVAVYSVLHTIYEICSSSGMGIAATVLTLSGLLYGEKDRSGLDQLIKLAVQYSLWIGMAVSAVVIVAANPIVLLFLKENASLAGECAAGIRIFILAIIPFSINSSMRSFYQGIHKTLLSQILCVSQNYVFLTGAVFISTSVSGNKGLIWASFIFAEVLTAILLIAIASVRNKRVAVRFSDYDMLECMEQNTPMLLKTTIDDCKGALAVSSAVQKLCDEQGARKNIGMILALCVEELAMNTLKYGSVGEKNSKPQIEIKLKRIDDQWILVMTDDASQFDPTKYYAMHEDSGDTEHIGIRMMHQLTGSIDYVDLLGMNCVTIKL